MARFTRAEIRAILGDANTDEIENRLIALHLAVVDPLKDDLQKYKADSERLTDVQKELDGLKANNGDDFKAKYESEHSAFEDYKKAVQAEKDNAIKADLVRAYFEEKGITGKNLDIAMRGASKEIEAIKLEDGKITDVSELDALIAGDYSGLVVETSTKGAPTATPPTGSGNKSGAQMTRAEIAQIKDTAQRQRAYAELLAAESAK